MSYIFLALSAYEFQLEKLADKFRRMNVNHCSFFSFDVFCVSVQIFESEILDKERKKANALKQIRFYGDLLIIAIGTSLVARVGYYMVYGKKGGAGPLPERK